MCRKFIQDNVYQILPESTGFRGRYDKNILVCFSVHSVVIANQELHGFWFILRCVESLLKLLVAD